jgi:hypothetical protein
VIAHCPACGTHYRHDILATPMRGRCGRCDAAIDLSRLRPYRLVVSRPAEVMALAAGVDLAEGPIEAAHLPAIASPTAAEVSAVPPPAMLEGPSWENEDPLPPIPEMAVMPIELRPMPADDDREAASPAAEGSRTDPESRTPRAAPHAEGRATTWLLWTAAGAIAGTGFSWTMGGTTIAGVASGTLAGAIAGWGWLRWMSLR